MPLLVVSSFLLRVGRLRQFVNRGCGGLMRGLVYRSECQRARADLWGRIWKTGGVNLRRGARRGREPRFGDCGAFEWKWRLSLRLRFDCGTAGESVAHHARFGAQTLSRGELGEGIRLNYSRGRGVGDGVGVDYLLFRNQLEAGAGLRSRDGNLLVVDRTGRSCWRLRSGSIVSNGGRLYGGGLAEWRRHAATHDRTSCSASDGLVDDAGSKRPVRIGLLHGDIFRGLLRRALRGFLEQALSSRALRDALHDATSEPRGEGLRDDAVTLPAEDTCRDCGQQEGLRTGVLCELLARQLEREALALERLQRF